MKLFKRRSKSTNVVDELMKIQENIDFDINQEKDSLRINEYLKELKLVLDRYDSIRSRIVSTKIKRELLLSTIDIIPVFSKYVDVIIDRDKYKEKSNLDNKEIMKLLKENYNSYSSVSLDVFNDTLLLVVLLVS